MARLKKRFGQHFLNDQTVLAQIAASIAPQPADLMVEIGPGAGALTRHLLPQLEQLTVVELDRDLIAGLETLGDDTPNATLHVVNADILDIDLRSLSCSQERMRIVGNLPYNISTPIIFKCMEHAAHIRDMHFLMQKEVVDRLTATPGSKRYGRLSVMVQYACRADKLFSVGPDSFSPPPKVDSALVRLQPHGELPYPAISSIQFSILVKAAFSQRRKTITNSLRKFISANDIESLGISPGIRPEQLSVEHFVQLSNHTNASENESS